MQSDAKRKIEYIRMQQLRLRNQRSTSVTSDGKYTPSYIDSCRILELLVYVSVLLGCLIY